MILFIQCLHFEGKNYTSKLSQKNDCIQISIWHSTNVPCQDNYSVSNNLDMYEVHCSMISLTAYSQNRSFAILSSLLSFITLRIMYFIVIIPSVTTTEKILFIFLNALFQLFFSQSVIFCNVCNRFLCGKLMFKVNLTTTVNKMFFQCIKIKRIMNQLMRLIIMAFIWQEYSYIQ